MKLYNTLSGQKEEFRPQGETVLIYVCGVTPYDECHVGHAMSYIFFDVLRRYMEFRGHKLRYVQNFTDIDDKIISRAREKGVTARELADKYIASYFRDMHDLNIKDADEYPYATKEVPEIIRLIQGLVEKGHAYVARGDVYFRVKSFPAYGRLSHRTLEGMLAGARVESGEGKEFPLDFALWKAAKPGEPSWPSPWGEGRPGWHIECSAMSLRYLGETLDIHGGGQDLIFPHHENEIAQSEAFTGKPFARFFIHNALLQLGREKMSKSLGNLVPVREVLDKWGPRALRLFVFSSHYRMPLTFSAEALEAAGRGAEKVDAAMSGLRAGKGQPAVDPEPFWQRFIDAMDDDLSTPQALAALYDLASEIIRADEKGTDAAAARETLNELWHSLGLGVVYSMAAHVKVDVSVSAKMDVATPLPSHESVMRLFEEVQKQLREAGRADLLHGKNTQQTTRATLQALVDLRDELRRAKEFALADSVRNGLTKLGVILEDTPRGTIWR
jgi:cysteinyl-tRNA synthetase